MSKDFNKAAEEFLRSGAMDSKKDVIKNAANTAYGKSVKEMLQKGGFEQAVQQGDVNALKDSISQVLKTEDGARLLRELSKIMEN